MLVYIVARIIAQSCNFDGLKHEIVRVIIINSLRVARILGGAMKLHINELEHGIRLIVLNGKLDSAGVYTIEMDFHHYCGGDHRRVLVDMSAVSYISSIGIPLLVNTAKAVAGKGGRMALYNPQKNVMDVLELVGVTHLIPVHFDLTAARSAFQFEAKK